MPRRFLVPPASSNQTMRAAPDDLISNGGIRGRETQIQIVLIVDDLHGEGSVPMGVRSPVQSSCRPSTVISAARGPAGQVEVVGRDRAGRP